MDSQFSAFLWKLLEGILVAVIPVLTAFVVAWLRQKVKEVASGLSSSQMASIEWAVSVAVNAAEQAGAAQLIADKKAYALDIAQKYLSKQGIQVDLSLLAGLVEATVKAEFHPAPAA